MFIPEVLASVSDQLVGHHRVGCLGPWTSVSGGLWSLSIRTMLSAAETELMPAETDWHIVFDPMVENITIYPSKAGGIKTTFQHQSYNDEGLATYPWRAGNPCLHRQSATFGRTAWDREPTAIDDRILWYVERLLIWIDCAATGELAVDGEPLELPSGPGMGRFPVIGFVGSDDDVSFWGSRTSTWGWADIAELPSAKSSYAIKAFRDVQRNVIRELRWGRLISNMKSSTTGLWIALDNVPVSLPWELPRTWDSLTSLLGRSEIDLCEIFEKAGADRRRRKLDKGSVTVLLGFPISEAIGGAPVRFHWIGIDPVKFSDRTSKQNGFRANEDNRRSTDRLIPTKKDPLKWIRAVNWEPTELRTRAGAAADIEPRRVLMLGAGSLGSGVAENLVRMGVTDLTIMDYDRLEVGNLTRHGLGMDAVGHQKATALANALSILMPDADVKGIVASFPPVNASTADQLRSYDVIIDCTGSDLVLDSMARFDWGGEKVFISIAMTWQAEGLLVFTASEASFPAIDAKERFGEIDLPPADLGDARMEGIGCWHPVFPASAADVRLWSSIATKEIFKAMKSPERQCIYFRQSEAGSVERFDV